MQARRDQRDRSIELLEDKADVLRKVADMAREIDGDAANRARGEDIELQAESDLAATESAIEALEDHRATLGATEQAFLIAGSAGAQLVHGTARAVEGAD